MGLFYRVASAALLILAIVFIKHHLDHIQDDSLMRPFWQMSTFPRPSSTPESASAPGSGSGSGSNSGSSSGSESRDQNRIPNYSESQTAAYRNRPAGYVPPEAKNEVNRRPGRMGAIIKPEEKGAGRPDTKPLSSNRKVWNKKPMYETTPITIPNDRVIVMARLKHEDTSWVRNDLGEWRNVVYTVNDPFASKHTPRNKGRESLAYLQYIVEHYYDLPSTIVFVHSHKDGWPDAWHTDTFSYSNVDSIRSLQLDHVQKTGYANLRCQNTPGCPDAIRPFRSGPAPSSDPMQRGAAANAEKFYAQAWRELFNNTQVPEVVAAPCCSQFAVSRKQVMQRPKADYDRFYRWVLNTALSDDVVAGIMEYTWHIIFGRDAVFCPDTFQCYQDVYGSAYYW